MSDKVLERLSALVDGELDGREGEQVLDSLLRDERLANTWESYQLISDVLRNNRWSPVGRQVLARVRVALQDEPAVVYLRPWRWSGLLKPLAGLATAASVAVVAVLGVRYVANWTGGAERVASSAPAALPVQSGTDQDRQAAERLSAYIVSHSGRSNQVVQGVLPYVRIVSYDAGP